MIEDDVVIGANSVVLEGAKLEKGSMIAPNSVVPPGRLVPAGQLWAGNPIEYVKHLDIGETFANYSMSYMHTFLGDTMKEIYTIFPSNYLLKKTEEEDLGNDEFMNKVAMTDMSHKRIHGYNP